MSGKTSAGNDAHTIEVAKTAVEWRVVIYVSRGTWCTLPAASLAHARAGGALLEQRLDHGRLSMVYAVDSGGRGVFVPRQLDAAILAA
jgi:hypothetical protein